MLVCMTILPAAAVMMAMAVSVVAVRRVGAGNGLSRCGLIGGKGRRAADESHNSQHNANFLRCI